MNQEFKTLIRTIKFKYHTTQAEIAKKLGVTTQYLSDVIGGRAPYNQVLKSKIDAQFPDIVLSDAVETAIMDFMRSKTYTVYDIAKLLSVSPTDVTNTIADGFTEDTARLWSEKFGFDMNFLLTGEGSPMLTKEKVVPLVPVTAQAGRLGDFTRAVTEYDCDKILSPVKDAELAIPISGESMYPEFPSGSIVFLKKINEKAFIEWGKPYVLDTVNGTVVKYLAPGGDGSVKCISANPDPMYAPFEVPLAEVFGVYRIVNLLCMK